MEGVFRECLWVWFWYLLSGPVFGGWFLRILFGRMFLGNAFRDISGGVLKDISLLWFQGMLLWVVLLNDTSGRCFWRMANSVVLILQ